MQEKRIVFIKNEINGKIKIGDYKTLASILGVPRSTAVSKYQRNNEKAVLILRDIINNKEKLIDKLQKKYLSK
jgi:hypothetical protein